MNTEFLRAFARRIATERRITPADVAQLREHEATYDGEFDGLSVADALLAIDAAAADSCEAWRSFFIDAMADILVWGERPTGVVSAAIADWLLARIKLDGGRAASASHRALLVALVREAHDCDPRLAATAFGYEAAAQNAPRAPVARTLGWLDASGLTI